MHSDSSPSSTYGVKIFHGYRFIQSDVITASFHRLRPELQEINSTVVHIGVTTPTCSLGPRSKLQPQATASPLQPQVKTVTALLRGLTAGRTDLQGDSTPSLAYGVKMLRRSCDCGAYLSDLPSPSYSLAWPRPFPRRLVGGAGGGEEGRRVW